MKELTTEERLQVFMLYPNAQFTGGKLLDMLLDKEQFPVVAKEIQEGRLQLILKSLEEITEEDKRELALLLGHGNCEEINFIIEEGEKELIFRKYGDYLTTTGYTEGIIISEMPYHAADYLRSRNYALPFKGVDLFASGIAVESPERSEDL